MESIKKYVEDFFKVHKKDMRFSVDAKELICAAMESKAGDAARVICDVFDFGYAKGYRAALNEMQKGGGC